MDEHGQHRVGRHAAANPPDAKQREEYSHESEEHSASCQAGETNMPAGRRTTEASDMHRRGLTPDAAVGKHAHADSQLTRKPTASARRGAVPDQPASDATHAPNVTRHASNHSDVKHSATAVRSKSRKFKRKHRKDLRLTPLGWLAIGGLCLIVVVAVVLLLPRGEDISESQLADAATLPPAQTDMPTALPSYYGLPDDENTAEDFSPAVEADASDNASSDAAGELPAQSQATAGLAWSPQPMGEIVPKAQPDLPDYGYQYRIVADGQVVDSYERAEPIAMGQGSDYSELEGVLCFRGNNYRDGPVYGTVPNDASGLKLVWSRRTGYIDSWTGVGWTGQPAIVRWPEELRTKMNIVEDKRAKDGLREVILGTLDGHIYFLDLDDGKQTRPPIAVPSSIKGSVSVDPRGIPLLYCGQGIDQVKGHDVELGTRIFSLIDQKKLFFLDGRDDFCLRHWYAFDCSPLVDASSDTLIHLGENGVAYTISLNTQYDTETGALSIDPVVDRHVYKSKVSTRPGMENSPVVYDHYAYYTDNSGLFTCLDLNTLTPVWLGYVGDDSDGTMVLEEDDEGVWIYTACELDLHGLAGKVYCRKINALTGELVWELGIPCSRYKEDVEAGGFASPAIGKGSLSELVYFNICRTSDNGIGHLGALNKATGEVVWQVSTGSYSWSSPVCVYDENGRGYVIYCNAGGMVRLLDGLTGKLLAEIHLEGTIEASPAVFDDMLVIGTRAQYIYGIRITN